jgi:hypothetical protein
MTDLLLPRPTLRLRIGALGALLAAVALVVGACAGSGASPTPTGPSVVVTTTDGPAGFMVAPVPPQAPAARAMTMMKAARLDLTVRGCAGAI